MRTYDITLTISPDLPTWPGDPGIVLERVGKIENGANANVSRLDMGVHSGTHVDAPYHFLPEGKTIDQLSLSLLTGRAYVLHLPEVETITAAVLKGAQIPPRTRRLLFKTRNSQYWSHLEDGFRTDFVGISADGAELLVKRGVKLIGVDYLSVAPYKESRPTHEILLSAGVVIIEGLDLSTVSQGRYTLFCLPLKLGGSDGAPARAILIGV
ncbi:MAG TPA: cyclase family protein [Anaerolineales bacterium]|jgi:arylformamidase|nr:cyclase family protein [Anaerolineales bacterium]